MWETRVDKTISVESSSSRHGAADQFLSRSLGIVWIVLYDYVSCQMSLHPQRRPLRLARPRNPTASCSAPPPAATSNPQVHKNSTVHTHTLLLIASEMIQHCLLSARISLYPWWVWQEWVSHDSTISKRGEARHHTTTQGKPQYTHIAVGRGGRACRPGLQFESRLQLSTCRSDLGQNTEP